MDGTGGGAAAGTGTALRYSVLYYKRTNKVHKNRGVSRLVSFCYYYAPAVFPIPFWNPPSSLTSSFETHTLVSCRRTGC